MESGDERGDVIRLRTHKMTGLDHDLDRQVLPLFWPKLE